MQFASLGPQIGWVPYAERDPEGAGFARLVGARTHRKSTLQWFEPGLRRRNHAGLNSNSLRRADASQDISGCVDAELRVVCGRG